jgi:hypothetical protein
MSTIHCDTIETSSAGPVTLTKANTVKVYLNFDGQNDTILDSFNISSTTDTYAGQYLYSFTSNMSSYAYGFANTAGGNGGSLGDDSFGSTGQFNSSAGTLSSSFKARYKGHQGNNYDASNCSMLTTGDLA